MSSEQPQSKNSPPIFLKRGAVDPGRNPDLRAYDSITLREGPRSRKSATHYEIVNRQTGELHHHAVKIETWRKTKAGDTLDEYHTVTIGDEDEDEISKLATFLSTVRGLTTTASGHHLVVEITDGSLKEESVRQVLEALSEAGSADVLVELLAQLQADPASLGALVQAGRSEPQKSQLAAAALNVGRFITALEQLQKLIQSNAKEAAFQALLAANPWMFGSEYSQILDRRRWTRDDQQDFMLRRTADGYLEAIEIKTPLGDRPLFRPDPSHDTLYPGPELAAALGQVLSYLEELDRDRDRIRVTDQEDVNKIRGKIIIGRDGDAEQITALRRLNGHLHRVEVMTFDQLVRIARQVVSYLTSASQPGQAHGL
jgi:hypothetical protein